MYHTRAGVKLYQFSITGQFTYRELLSVVTLGLMDSVSAVQNLTNFENLESNL